MSRRTRRTIAVTAGLVLAGAAFGAVAAVLGFALFLVLTARGVPGEYAMLRDGEVLRVVVGIGAAFGVVLGPVVGWIALRAVPLWLAIGGATAGTIVGAAFGIMLLPYGAFIGAVAGAVAASGVVRVLASRDRIGRQVVRRRRVGGP